MKYILSITIAILMLSSCSTNPNNGGNTTTVIPSAPSNLVGTLASNTQVDLSWTDLSTNETGFKIERRLDGGNFGVVGTVNTDVVNFSDVGLTPNTNYTYRVVSFNAVGISLTYSNEWSVNTGGTMPSGSTVTICNQVWMTKNLEVSTYRNGDVIPQVIGSVEWENLTTGAWCYYVHNTANGIVYGKLYNWYAVNDPRGLAPTGYHIPSDAEWTSLENCLGGNTVAGGKMKSITGWNSPNTGATNSSGFTGLPGGYRDDSGIFTYIGNNGYWWSSTQINTADAYVRFLYNTGVGLISFNYPKSFGFSVRCLSD